MDKPVWYDTFEMLLATSKAFNMAKAKDEETSEVINLTYFNILKEMDAIEDQYGPVQTLTLLIDRIVDAAQSVKYDSYYRGPKQAGLNKLIKGDKEKERVAIVGFVENEMKDAAKSMRRFVGLVPGSKNEFNLLNK